MWLQCTWGAGVVELRVVRPGRRLQDPRACCAFMLKSYRKIHRFSWGEEVGVDL